MTLTDKDINNDDIKRIINDSDLPQELKEGIINELPHLLENVNEVAKSVYDPNQVWLEAIQYADYVEQHLIHIMSDHGDECTKTSLETLEAMTKSFKLTAEYAMRVLDTLNVESNLVDWNKVEITYRKDDDAQQ